MPYHRHRGPKHLEFLVRFFDQSSGNPLTVNYAPCLHSFSLYVAFVTLRNQVVFEVADYSLIGLFGLNFNILQQ